MIDVFQLDISNRLGTAGRNVWESIKNLTYHIFASFRSNLVIAC